MILECKNLNKKLGNRQILFDISFNIKEKDILGFIGPNGSGKTTTIKTLIGLHTLDSGTVKIDGYDVKHDFKEAIKYVGAIVENPDFYMYLSGRKNLEVLANMYEDIEKDRIDEVVELVGLKDRINDKVSKYSLGMRQRLGIAQAILHKPKLLILDEPTNGLDPEGIKDLRTLLLNLVKKEGMSVLISSHNLKEVESICNQICIIQNGRILEQTSLSKLKKSVVTSKYVFEVNNTKDIEKTLEIENKIEILDNNHISIEVEKKNLQNIIKKMIDKNIEIYMIQGVELSLEEAFLQKTGGNQIV